MSRYRSDGGVFPFCLPRKFQAPGRKGKAAATCNPAFYVGPPRANPKPLSPLPFACSAGFSTARTSDRLTIIYHQTARPSFALVVGLSCSLPCLPLFARMHSTRCDERPCAGLPWPWRCCNLRCNAISRMAACYLNSSPQLRLPVRSPRPTSHSHNPCVTAKRQRLDHSPQPALCVSRRPFT